MTDRESFEKHLEENPEDDNTRLVYADWLDDHHDAWWTCPSCAGAHLHVANPWPGQRGYRPESDPASGRHEGGWSNCKTCNSGRPDTKPGFVIDPDANSRLACNLRLVVVLTKIRNDPDNDAPRLEYAATCRQYGRNKRAEFIDVQLRMEDVRKTCWCGSCIALRGGGQHHNGPCALDKQQDDGGKSLRFVERELWSLVDQWWGEPLPGKFVDLSVPGRAVVDQCVYVTARRGFFTSVNIPARKLVGGPCRLCGPYAYDGPNASTQPGCVNCGGTGVAPSFAPQLFNHPIGFVTISDKRPRPYHPDADLDDPGPHYGWFWQVNGFEQLGHVGAVDVSPLAIGVDDNQYIIPSALFYLLDRRSSNNNTPHVVTYPTEEAAVAALNAAALAYGRKAFADSRKPKTP